MREKLITDASETHGSQLEAYKDKANAVASERSPNARNISVSNLPGHLVNLRLINAVVYSSQITNCSKDLLNLMITVRRLEHLIFSFYILGDY